MIQDSNDQTIQILDPATVNQIAAGEVVERPASVVKELVENAIDASANTVRIDITSVQGGISTIRVTDDGCGMSPADAELAFAPHATSKITKLDDLFYLHTLGFRGEALASIAAVAKVTLITKARGSTGTAGTRLVVIGGIVREKRATGAPEGTNVLVEELFFNTPARKKFQKSLNTELARVYGILEGLCLAYPRISFRLFYNNREQLATERTSQLLNTITRIFGNECAHELLPVSAELPLLRISGYISRPGLSRKDHGHILVSINGRYITSSSLTVAIREGYGSLLPRGRFPVAFLSLSLDTRLVDVNVHPTKKEVRLTKEKEITESLRDIVFETLRHNNLIPDGPFSQQEHTLTEVSEAPALAGVADPSARYEVKNLGFGEIAAPAASEAHHLLFTEPTHKGTLSTDHRLRQTEVTGISPVSAFVPPMEVIGQVGGIYILAAAPDGELIIIDQHAAHERIFYEKISRTHATKNAQELLIPVVIHRPPKDAAILRDLIPALTKEGIVIEEFGSDAFLVRAVPAIMGKCEGQEIIDDLVSDLMSTDLERPLSDRERITRIIACRSAIKAGTVCTYEQSQRIVNQLRAIHSPFTCPHGRPTMIRFTRAKLDEMFGRT